MCVRMKALPNCAAWQMAILLLFSQGAETVMSEIAAMGERYFS